MLYRIEIQGDTNGELFYGVSFQSGIDQLDKKKFNSDDIKDIHTTVEHLADALKNLPTAKA